MRILIADDDRVSRIAVEELFSTRHAAELVSVDSGNAAWAALREDPRFVLGPSRVDQERGAPRSRRGHVALARAFVRVARGA